jgi:usherin
MAIHLLIIISSGPGGVQAPVVHIISPTSIEIQWAPPIQPNGRLESYVIALPEPRFDITNTSQRALIVENLTPYTNYSVTVTACSGMINISAHSLQCVLLRYKI